MVTPPLIKPAEPGLPAAAAAEALRARGVDATSLDASIDWFWHAMGSERLDGQLAQLAELSEHGKTEGGVSPGVLLAYRRAARNLAQCSPDLRQLATYTNKQRYTSAVRHVVNALKLASSPYEGVQLRVSDVAVAGRRPASSEHLEAFASAPGPFDDYVRERLIPRIEASGVTHVGLSATFYHQAWAVFRIARLLQEHMPSVRRLLGGPLIACWAAVGQDLSSPLFQSFDAVYPEGSDEELDALAVELGGAPISQDKPRIVALGEAPWERYLVPRPTVPLAVGRGCYYGRCTFCPDHIHPRYLPCSTDALGERLRAIADRFPDGAMLHLTDSALSPKHLERVADTIIRERLPLRWHGFVRMEPAFARAGFAEHLAAGGATMLQFGMESASPRMLDTMRKGLDPERARAVLRATAAQGIRNHVYLLFGLPGERDEDREATLAFVEEEILGNGTSGDPSRGPSIHDMNNAILNLARGSPMHREPERYGITEITPFGQETDLSLYDDFRCGDVHPRVEARRWLDRRFFKSPAVRQVLGGLTNPFAANHACFLPR